MNITALGCGVIKYCHHWKCEDVNGGRRKKRVGKAVIGVICLFIWLAYADGFIDKGHLLHM